MKTKGFTLVELLVVIAILAILATVSVVGYTTYINNANDSVAVQELSQLRDAALAVDLTDAGNMNGKVNGAEFTAAVSNAGMDINDFTITYDTTDTTLVTKVVYNHENGGHATWTVSGNKIEAGTK